MDLPLKTTKPSTALVSPINLPAPIIILDSLNQILIVTLIKDQFLLVSITPSIDVVKFLHVNPLISFSISAFELSNYIYAL